MADKNTEKALRLQRRKYSGRKGLFGTPERPRLTVFRSSKHIYAQLIDDYAGKTLAQVGTAAAEVRGPELKNGGNIAPAQLIGQTIAQRAKALGVTKVALDRARRTYHRPGDGLAGAAPARWLQV